MPPSSKDEAQKCYVCLGTCGSIANFPMICHDESCWRRGSKYSQKAVVFACDNCYSAFECPGHCAGCGPEAQLIARVSCDVCDARSRGNEIFIKSIGPTASPCNTSIRLPFKAREVIHAYTRASSAPRHAAVQTIVTDVIKAELNSGFKIKKLGSTISKEAFMPTVDALIIEYRKQKRTRRPRPRPLPRAVQQEEPYGLFSCGNCPVVKDATHLPATVAANYVHAQQKALPWDGKPLIKPELPKNYDWCGREVFWNTVDINGEGNCAIVAPRSLITISVDYETKWEFNPNDYCPDSIVQLYYGMANRIRRGLIQRGIHNCRGQDIATYKAPLLPGIYYIKPAISLQDGFVPGSCQNDPNQAIAVIRVRENPEFWNPTIHQAFDPRTREFIYAVLLANHRLAKIPTEIVLYILRSMTFTVGNWTDNTPCQFTYRGSTYI
eukprot:m.135567 g.135567  ORF g.135567 m.135567 type:complete len:438 (-) comp14713_c0_seq16:114-1427(-)